VVVLAVMSGTPIGPGAQDGTAQPVLYDIVFEVRCRRLKSDLYPLIQTLRRLVAGQRVTKLGLLTFAGWELLERNPNQDYWGAIVRFSATAMDGPYR